MIIHQFLNISDQLNDIKALEGFRRRETTSEAYHRRKGQVLLKKRSRTIGHRWKKDLQTNLLNTFVGAFC